MIRVRFAPAPTGMMHLGNIRIALLNFLFARKKQGTFVLRIEDTDPERMFDPGAEKILHDLAWLGISYDEGPSRGGPYAPYFQSERTAYYEQALQKLQEKNRVYRCFCTTEELEKKRQRQIALKMPPRYDRTCFKLNADEINAHLEEQRPYIWRFTLDHEHNIAITDLAKGVITFDMNNFSDFPLTRTNNTFTFLFTNAVDDMLMNISHVLRGEDHLSNTANQAALLKALGATLPLYWHLPILCNIEGKKLSKRDFGFSLRDLRHGGYLAQAILNYLVIIGGSYEREIMTMSELLDAIDFERIRQSGAIKYDVDKLNWVNHKWINRIPLESLVDEVRPFLYAAYPEAAQLTADTIARLVETIRSELTTFTDTKQAAAFYFNPPTVGISDLIQHLPSATVNNCLNIMRNHLDVADDGERFLAAIKNEAQQQRIKPKDIFLVVRMVLTGKTVGPSVKDMVALLGKQECVKRFKPLLQGLSND